MSDYGYHSLDGATSTHLVLALMCIWSTMIIR